MYGEKRDLVITRQCRVCRKHVALRVDHEDDVAADPLWRFAQQVIEEAEALLPKAHQSGIGRAVADRIVEHIPDREREMADELENSLLRPLRKLLQGHRA